MFYYNVSDRYFVLDEDLKVLNVVNTKDELNEGLIKINPVKLSESSNEPVTTNILGADINTKTNNFIGNEYKNIFPNLYKAIYNTVKLDKDGEMAFVDREDIKQLVSEVSFKVGYAYERLVLSVNYPQGEQSYSYTIDIAKPNENLQSKINWCFSSIPELIKHDKHGGTIRCYYDDAGKEICKYFD